MRIVNAATLQREPVSHDPDILKTVLVRNGEITHVTNVSQVVILPRKSTTEHAHKDMTEIFIVTSGQGVVCVDSKSYSVTRGSCVVVEPGERHAITCSGQKPLEVTYFGVV